MSQLDTAGGFWGFLAWVLLKQMDTLTVGCQVVEAEVWSLSFPRWAKMAQVVDGHTTGPVGALSSRTLHPLFRGPLFLSASSPQPS